MDKIELYLSDIVEQLEKMNIILEKINLNLDLEYVRKING